MPSCFSIMSHSVGAHTPSHTHHYTQPGFKPLPSSWLSSPFRAHTSFLLTSSGKCIQAPPTRRAFLWILKPLNVLQRRWIVTWHHLLLYEALAGRINLVGWCKNEALMLMRLDQGSGAEPGLAEPSRLLHTRAWVSVWLLHSDLDSSGPF